MRTVLSACALVLLATAVPGLPAGAQTPPAPQMVGGGGETAPPVVGGGEATAPQRIERTAAVGEALDIRLDGNATTGYLWAIDPAASQGLDTLTATGDSYETAAPQVPPPATETPAVDTPPGAAAGAPPGAPPGAPAGVGGVPVAGAPGVQVFHFVAAAPGTARVVFVYRRPWVPLAVEKTAEALITVK